MKLSFTFQTLIMVALTPVLIVITAFWGAFVYRSVYDTILRGFDRKLIAVSNSASAFIDGDAHASYQRRRVAGALTTLPSSPLLASDTTTGELFSIDAPTGAARPLVSTGPALRSLATVPGSPQLAGLSADGKNLLLLDPSLHRVDRTLPLTEPLDGLFITRGTLNGWHDLATFRIDPTNGHLAPLPLKLPAPFASITTDPDSGDLIALSTDRASLCIVDAQGRLTRQTPLVTKADPPAAPGPLPLINQIAVHDGKLFGAGSSLTTIDFLTGLVSSGDSTIGFFDREEVFYRRYRSAFIELRKNSGLTYLYTQVYLGGKKIYYVLDGTSTDAYSPPGSGDELPPETVDGAELVVYLGKSWTSPIQHWDAWGMIKSGFGPVQDSSGKIIAMAGADVDISIIRKKTRLALFDVVFVGLGTLIVGGLISFFVARGLTRPLREIKDSALWIAAGYYGKKVDARGTREVGRLADSLNVLSTRLAEQEKRAQSYQDRLDSSRRASLLARALSDLGDGNPSAAQTTNTFTLPPDAGIAWLGTRAALWHAPHTADPLASACRHARLACLARTFAQHSPDFTPASLLTSLFSAAPTLSTCAIWQNDTRQLHLRSTQPLHLSLVDPAGKITRIDCPDTAVVVIPPAHRLVWHVSTPAPTAALATTSA